MGETAPNSTNSTIGFNSSNGGKSNGGTGSRRSRRSRRSMGIGLKVKEFKRAHMGGLDTWPTKLPKLTWLTKPPLHYYMYNTTTPLQLLRYYM